MKKRIISVYLIIAATLLVISILYYTTTYLSNRSFMEARANLASTDLSSLSLKVLKLGESLEESVSVIDPFSTREGFVEYEGKPLYTEKELLLALGDNYLECKNANTNAPPSIIYHDQVNHMQLTVDYYSITFSKIDQPLVILEPEYKISNIITYAPYATWYAVLRINYDFGRGNSFSILDHIVLPLFFALLLFPAAACFVYKKKRLIIAVTIGYAVFGVVQYISLLWFMHNI